MTSKNAKTKRARMAIPWMLPCLTSDEILILSRWKKSFEIISKRCSLKRHPKAIHTSDLLHKTRYLFIFRNSTYEKSGCVATVLTAFSKAKVRSR